jgi:hypothetical protein
MPDHAHIPLYRRRVSSLDLGFTREHIPPLKQEILLLAGDSSIGSSTEVDIKNQFLNVIERIASE